MEYKVALLHATLLTALYAPASLALEAAPEPTPDYVEGGLIFVDDDAYRFGRYTGLEEDGAYLLGDVRADGFADEGRFWSIRGTNLGLTSRYLRIEGGYLGKQHYFLEYDQLPHYKSNSGRTPYLNVGSAGLALPAGFDITTSLPTTLMDLDLETERKRLGVGASLFPRSHWKVNVAFSNENKDGIDRLGGMIANGPTQVVGNATAALLPEPIDYQTRKGDIALQYADDNRQLELKYHVSLFENNNAALTWEDPFAPGTFGSIALEPDNEFHQVSVSGGYLISDRTRVNGVLAIGRMTQDQDFQPYSIRPGLQGTLPTSSLDGEVWMRNAQFKLVSRPSSPLRLDATYRYTERDNQTPVYTWDPVVGDSFVGTSLQNRPLSYDRNELDLTANYRFNSMHSLRGGYQFDRMSRDYVDAERKDTEEDTLYARWKIQARDDLDVALYAETAQRDGDDYQVLATENPALRKYHLADRDRNKVGASVGYLPTDTLSLSASADYIKDDYDDSVVGLTEATQPTLNFDVAYYPRHNVTTYAFLTLEDIESKQAGSSSVATSPDWRADFEDSVTTIGLGGEITRIRAKWDVGADLVYSKARGEIQLADLSAPGTEDQFPDTETNLASLELWTQYQYSKDMTLKFSYWYEDYDADNWAYDGLVEDSVSNMLLLGEDTLDYEVNLFAVSLRYRFN